MHVFTCYIEWKIDGWPLWWFVEVNVQKEVYLDEGKTARFWWLCLFWSSVFLIWDELAYFNSAFSSSCEKQLTQKETENLKKNPYLLESPLLLFSYANKKILVQDGLLKFVQPVVSQS